METHGLKSAQLCALILLVGCGSAPPPPAEYPPVEEPPAPVVAEAPPAPAEEPPPPPPPVQVVASEATPYGEAAPTVKIKAPAAGKLIKSGDVMVTLEAKNWPLSPEGSHLHVIVDNEPYIAVRDISKPINLSALVRDNLGHELAEGTHVLRVFPGHGHHESVKLPTAFAVVVFHYKKKSDGFSFDPKAPLLTFSRPKGCVASGTRVLLDFFVSNVELSAEGTRVRYTIDGDLTGDIATWAPHQIENLADGAHTLQLTLVSADGTPVPGMFNDTTRTITVAADCNAAAAATPTPAAEAPATPAPAATETAVQ